MNKQLLFSWIIAAFVMFGVSYVWHGVILNDLANITFPKSLFLGLSGLLYLIISAILVGLISAVRKSETVNVKAFTVGASLGFVIYLVAFIFGISFNSLQLEHIILDFTWQMLEQAFGAVTVWLVYVFIEKSKEAKEFEIQ